MLQHWNIRSRSHQCAVSQRPFTDGEWHYTAIYDDPETGGYLRRDVAFDSWEQELSERKPFSFWKSVYTKNAPEERPEITSKESGMNLLQSLIVEDEPHTENARYILALMLERKRMLSPTAVKETEKGRMLFYENRKTGEAFVIRDPELRLDEIAGVQEEVATLLGFAGPDSESPRALAKKAKEAASPPEEPAPVVEETTSQEPAPDAEPDPETEVVEDSEVVFQIEEESDSVVERSEEVDEEVHPGL